MISNSGRKIDSFDSPMEAHKLADLWADYYQTCKDCGPFSKYTIELHNEVYQRMFKFLMVIEGSFTEFEENNSLYTKFRNGYLHQEHLVNNIEDYEKFRKAGQSSDSFFKYGIYFPVHKYTQAEEFMYERIESSLVKPLLTLKKSYTYNF